MKHISFDFGKTLSCAALLIMSACEHQAPAEITPPGAFPSPPPEATREIQLTLGSNLQQCPNVLIRFPFDESQPLPQDTPELQGLAACLNSGPYQGVRLRLIGRTDRAGTDAYNQKLGQRRAEYVKNALMHDGVDAGRIDIESAGPEGAGEGAPGYDRRVEVVQLVAIKPI